MSRQGKPGLRRTEGVPSMPRELVYSGACARHPQPGWWRSSVAAEVQAAKLVCQSCPVLQICRSWALSIRTCDDMIMTLGGLSAAERAEIRKQRKRSAA